MDIENALQIHLKGIKNLFIYKIYHDFNERNGMDVQDIFAIASLPASITRCFDVN